ncbi:MAG: Calx-beta domain-containing protein [Planctomycetota bacterium]
MTVDVVQTGGSATSGSDFAAFSATTVTFPAGAADGATQAVDVTILGGQRGRRDAGVRPPEPQPLERGPVRDHSASSRSWTTTCRAIAFELDGSAVGESAGFTGQRAPDLGRPDRRPVTVQVVEVGGGSAASAVDYTPFGPTTVTFPAGSQNATQGVSITITNDGALEPNETFGLGLQAPTGAASLGGTTQHVVTIVDDDTPSVGFQAASSATTDESTSTFQVTLVLNAPAALATPLTVDVVDLGSGSAASGTDYTAFPTTTVTFPGGSVNGATQTVDLTPTQDTAVEVSETVVLGLQNVTNGNLGTTTQHTVTITDDDYTVAFQAATTVLASEDPVATAVQLQLSTGVALPAAVSVTVSDAGSGSATSGTDYPTLPATVVTFPAGSTHGTLMAVSVGATQDALIEGAETIDLALSAPTGGATLGAQATHQVTITDDDFRVFFSAAASSTGDEAASPASFGVVLNTGDPIASPISVQVVDTGSGSATSGVDYVAYPTTTLTFPVGSTSGTLQTVSVTPVQDAITETGGETVILALQNPSGAISARTPPTLTISDDDTSYVTFDAASSSTPDESTAARSVAVRLVTGAALVAPISVEVAALSTGTATSGTDYTAFTTTTVTFPTGSTDGSTQSVSVTPTQDSDVEAGETVLLGLQNPSGASLGTDTVHTLTITDDDVTVSFSSASSSVAEGAGTASINVVLNTGAALGAAVSVAVGPTGGTAGGSDYSLTVPTTLTFPAGSTAGATQSLAVTITDDAVVESDETLVLSLLFATGGATIVSPSSHTLTITDDDTTVSKVLYVADQDTSGVYELYLVTVTNGVASSSQKVSGSLVSGGDVSTSTTGSGVSPDGKWAA